MFSGANYTVFNSYGSHTISPWCYLTGNFRESARIKLDRFNLNRFFTFGVRGRDGLVSHHATGLVAFAVALGLTSGSLGLLHFLVPEPGAWVEVGVLTVANAVATVVRFLALRLAMAQRRPRSGTAVSGQRACPDAVDRLG